MTSTATATRTADHKAGKFTYAITAPDGTVLTKNAKAVYSHAILIHSLNINNKSVWRVHGMAGSAQLAAKSAAFFGDWSRGIYDVLIVPVEVAG